MSSATPINPTDFVALLRPYLQGQDLSGMAALLQNRWDDVRIAELFSCQCPDARKVAALAYGLVGGENGLAKLAELLCDPDPMVGQMAEHAMWSVWFRLGTKEANHEVCRGTRAMNRGEIDHAIRSFTRAIELDPSFAEAYNQRAIANFLLERYDQSMDDCRQAVRLMPCHFGALAGLGHCHAQEGHLVPALKCYEKALAINPHMEDIRQTVAEIRGELCPPKDRCS